MNTKQKMAIGIGLAAMLGMPALLPLAASAEELVAVVSGGRLLEAFDKHYFGPFGQEHGVDVTLVPGSNAESFTKLRVDAQTGQVTWDLVWAVANNLQRDQDLLEKIDCSRIPSANLPQNEGVCTDYGVLRVLTGSMMVWRTDAFPDGGPQNWADFWDTERFPGKRCMQALYPRYALRYALMADGVAREDLFPVDVGRAIAKIEEIKPHVAIWWRTSDQSQQAVRNNECTVAMMWAAQAFDLLKEGVPIDFTWHDAIRSYGYWAIPKDAPNKDAAYAFLEMSVSNAAADRAFFEDYPSDTPNSEVFAELPEDERRFHISVPGNFELTLPDDLAWTDEQIETMDRRFLATISQ